MPRTRGAFVYAGMEGHYERPSCYGPGGFFPVRIGDLLGPAPSRYRIVTKLGHGSYATVWLARDLVGERIVALKIVEAKESEGSSEAQILERLRAPPSVEPGVLQLFDSFTVKSPNGVHQVLVTELVLSLQKYRGLTQQRMTKGLVYQLIQGIAFVHAHGIAHGDLHPGNIGVALPELDAFSETTIWESITPPDILPLIAYDPARDPASFPSYLCEAIDLNSLLEEETLDFPPRGPPRVRIIDLGSAYSVEMSPPPPCKTPLVFMPPEVIFPQVLDRENAGHWDRRSDIWSLACLLQNLVSAQFLFARPWGPTIGDRLIRTMARGCGAVPEAWAKYLSVPAAEFTSVQADDFWKDVQISDKAVEDVPGYLRLMRRMLVIDPAVRPTAEELLQDPYFDSLKDAGVERMVAQNVETLSRVLIPQQGSKRSEEEDSAPFASLRPMVTVT
ncbi:kinase-like domain-containing protein [Mycena vitilis]|nr:kinase-like domain-containing protein [Mycena vitilis]